MPLFSSKFIPLRSFCPGFSRFHACCSLRSQCYTFIGTGWDALRNGDRNRQASYQPGNIVTSADTGDPFNVANARRLRTIGWALLVLQLLDIPAAVVSRVYPSLGTASHPGDFSAGGWVAVLMVFVLSVVFA